MTHHISRHGISIDSRLHEFIHSECLPHTAIEEEGFWRGFGTLIRDLAPRNARLLQRRDDLQAQIDACLSNAFAFGGLNAVLVLRRG